MSCSWKQLQHPHGANVRVEEQANHTALRRVFAILAIAAAMRILRTCAVLVIQQGEKSTSFVSFPASLSNVEHSFCVPTTHLSHTMYL